MLDDAQLLLRYADNGDEAAFTELVRRNLSLVYAAALRHVGDEHGAKDVAQSVFIDLARKAGSLRRHPALVSWLYTSTRYAASKTLRAQHRRSAREQQAHTMQQIISSDGAPDWDRLRPILDDVMHELGERDREIVLLRYFRGLTFAELAAQLKLSEGALRMRVERALDKMNGLLVRRGIGSTAVALGVALSSQPVVAIPTSFATTVTGVALASALGVGTAGVVGTLFLMSKTKIALIALIVAGGIATAVIEHNRTLETQATLAALAKDRDALSQKVSNLTKLMAEAKARAVESAVPAPARAESPVAPAVVARIEEPPVPGVSRVAPAGWHKNGSKVDAYVVGVDKNQMWNGQPSAYVQSLDRTVEGFGGMMQTNSAEDIVGKRVRLSGWVKTEDANEGGGHLWLRIDGKQGGGSPLQFDNMDSRPAKGTTDWQQASVVLDVPADATAVAYGFFVQGGGKMWVSGAKMEPVGPEVPSTNMMKPGVVIGLPKAPVNLNFDPDRS